MNKKGFTLVEVLVGIVLVAVVVVSSMGVAVTSTGNAGRMDRRREAAQRVRALSDALRGYVTADPSLAAGPGDGPDGWRLPGDACACAALAAGRHELDPGYWLGSLAAAPYGGTIAYTVTYDVAAAGAQPTVAFDVAWSEP